MVAAQKITKFANHAQAAERTVARLASEAPTLTSELIRAACGLSAKPEEASELQLRVRVRGAAEEKIVADFLSTYQRNPELAEEIAARLKARAPLLHPAELFRAVVGLPAPKVGAPEGNQNAAKSRK